jgi:nicotinamide mononucleotide transporter
MIETVPQWVWDWSGSLFFLISLVLYWTKRPSAWHWSNASLLPYTILFVVGEMWMLAGLQVIYLMFGGHGWLLWKLQEWGNVWAKTWERLAVPFGVVIFAYTVYVTQFADMWAWLQFAIVSISIAGSVLLVLKKSAAWLVYIPANLIGIVYYAHAGLWALTFVQVCAIVMSVYGYMMWRTQEKFFERLTGDKIV